MDRKQIRNIFFTSIVGLTFFSFSEQVTASEQVTSFSEFYNEDEQGLHIVATGKTETGDSWTLREYRPEDFEAQWSIVNENVGENKLYPSVLGTPNKYKPYSKESVRERREKSLQRFSKGNPWGIMSLLNDKGQSVLTFWLGRRTGSVGPARWGHGHIGLTLDHKEAPKKYLKSFLTVLTKQLAPEICRLGEDTNVPEKIRYNFTHKNSLTEKESSLDVGPLTHIDCNIPPYVNDLREDLLATGFKYDTEEAIDLRKETAYLQESTFETLEKDFLSQFQGKLAGDRRYLITGPKGEEIAVWHSQKWGGIRLCFVYDIK